MPYLGCFGSRTGASNFLRTYIVNETTIMAERASRALSYAKEATMRQGLVFRRKALRDEMLLA